MYKALIGALVIGVLACAAPSYAQGAFADVPVDHWAYEAVSQLQDQGVIIGYPDGTFSGKRAMTRYEFAVAISRLIPVIQDMVKPGGTTPPDLSGYASKSELADLEKKLSGMGKGGDVTMADLDAVKKLVNEFKDELSGLGVDLDALKRDVASLEERTAALEELHKRFKVNTKLNFFSVFEAEDDGSPVDKDGRRLAGDDNLLQNVFFVRDADLIFSYDAGGATAKVALNAGSYLGGYLEGQLSDFVGGRRTEGVDSVDLFMAYGSAPLWGADLTVGRFPIQFTKWTLKKYDVDSYTENWKTDDGNQYVDGAKVAWTWGTVDILAFAGKNNAMAGAFELIGRSGVGILPGAGAGLLEMVEQSAGVHAAFNLGSAKVGATYLTFGEGANASNMDTASVYGADVDFSIGKIAINAAYTQSDASFAPGGTLNDENAAWEVGAATTLGKLGINANYRRVEPNFAAPGDWGLMGRWQNPVNLQGATVGLNFPFSDSLSVMASGSWLDGVEDRFARSGDGVSRRFDAYLDADSKVQWYKAGVEWKTDPKGSFGVSGEWVRWDPSNDAGNPMETYYTFSYARMLTDNTKVRLLYSLIDYDADGLAAGNAGNPYGRDYQGSVATAQVSMDF